MDKFKIAFYHKHLINPKTVGPAADCLQNAGHKLRLANDGVMDNWRDDDLLWIQGNANWYPRICRTLEQAGTERPPVVIWHTEPLPPRPGSGYKSDRLHLHEIRKILLRDPRATDPYTNSLRIRRLQKYGLPDILAVSSRSWQQYLTSRRINSHFIPFGYESKRHGRLLGLPRDIDVLFLGTTQTSRRRRLLKQLRRAGVDVRAEGKWDASGTWGEYRTNLLNRTKILLNLQRHPGELAGMRMILGMSNGALVISEPIDHPDPYIPGKHFIEAPVGQMPAVIRHYLECADEREQITREAHRLVVDKLTMQVSVNHILELARAYTRRREDSGIAT